MARKKIEIDLHKYFIIALYCVLFISFLIVTLLF